MDFRKIDKLSEQASLYGSVAMAAVPPFLTLLSAPIISKKPLSESARLFENLHLLRMLWLLSFLPSEAHSLFLVFRSSFLLVPSWSLLRNSELICSSKPSIHPQAQMHTHAHPSCGLPVIVFTRTQSNLQNENCNRITPRHRIV